MLQESEGVGQRAVAPSCYFRTSTQAPYRKALIQITERCNLHCLHCFLNASSGGADMSIDRIRDVLTPRLLEAHVIKITLTGGEPTVHPHVRGIAQHLVASGFSVGVCSNGTLLTPDDITFYRGLGRVHFNISLDGLRPESHGRFRGDPASLALTLQNLDLLGKSGLLQGILVTPNAFAASSEYLDLCRRAKDLGARYVLLNPLSRMGRGNRTYTQYGTDQEEMREIARLTAAEVTRGFEVLCVRFPNDSRPLGACEAGRIIYVFTSGDVAVCPYLVFAARGEHSQHAPSEFIVGNVFTDQDVVARLDAYHLSDRYNIGANSTCATCGLAGDCGKGCPAAVVASGGRIGERDADVCPVSVLN